MTLDFITVCRGRGHFEFHLWCYSRISWIHFFFLIVLFSSMNYQIFLWSHNITPLDIKFSVDAYQMCISFSFSVLSFVFVFIYFVFFICFFTLFLFFVCYCYLSSVLCSYVVQDLYFTLLCEVHINSIGKSFVFFSTRIVYNFYMQKLYPVKLL